MTPRSVDPQLLCLEIASCMLAESRQFTSDQVVSDRLVAAATLLQHIASGIVEGAVRAADEKEEYLLIVS